MAKVNLTTIKNWFKTGLEPTQEQFFSAWDSFWHKDDVIPAENIKDFDTYLQEKADNEALQNHINDEEAHNGNQQFSETQVDRLKELVYENATQSISVSPTSFEKGTATDLTFTWRVIKNDDTLTSVTLDGNNVTADADGTNKQYQIANATTSKSVALQTVLDRNGSAVNLNNTATSADLLYAFWGIFNEGTSPTDSATIRGLSKQFLNTAHKGTITTNIQSGSGLKEISFYVKKGNNYQVTDLGNLGLDITVDFTKTDVTVKDGGNTDEQYEKVTKSLGADFGIVNFKFKIV